MWSCVQHRCFTVTLTANPHLRARAGSQRASSQASFTPTPPLCFELKFGRVCNSEVPRPPRMLAPSIPRGRR